MTVDTFLEITEQRVPTVPEMVELCDSLDIKFVMKDGKPFIRPCPECQEIANTMMTILRREPFRSEVLAAKFANGDPRPSEKEIKKEPDERIGPDVPQDAVIVIADRDGYTDRAMKGPAFTWTWVGAKLWFYVSEFKPPMRIS